MLYFKWQSLSLAPPPPPPLALRRPEDLLCGYRDPSGDYRFIYERLCAGIDIGGIWGEQGGVDGRRKSSNNRVPLDSYPKGRIFPFQMNTPVRGPDGNKGH